MPTRSRSCRPFLLAAAALTLAACTNKEQPSTAGDSAAAGSNAAAGTTAGAAAAGGEQTPDAGGKVVTVTMLTDEQGNNKFDPAEVAANKGDVVRFTLKQGAHNVHFLADSNAGKSGLPAASDILQLPGQTYDLKVSLAPGTYYFQCDPHALLGMKGHLTVK